MKTLFIKICHIFAIFWFSLVFLFVLLGSIGIVISEPSLISGLNKLLDAFSPFHVAQYLLIAIISLPGLISFQIEQYLRKKLAKEQARATQRGKTPLKELADSIVKGMLKNLNSDYQSKH